VLLIAVAVVAAAVAVAVQEAAAQDTLVIQGALAFEVPRLHSSMMVDDVYRLSHRHNMKWDAAAKCWD